MFCAGNVTITTKHICILLKLLKDEMIYIKTTVFFHENVLLTSQFPMMDLTSFGILFKRISSTLMICLIISASAYSQDNSGTILGEIIESGTNEPLRDANIYLSNTTIGTTSNESGVFRISNLDPGIYQVVVRYIGFKEKVFTIQVESGALIDMGTVSLARDQVNLNDVNVTSSKDEEWQNNLNRFKSIFMGENYNPDNIRIVNPEILEFDTDFSNTNITVSAADELQIENEALGYNLFITLLTFQWNLRDDGGQYFFTARINEMTSNQAEEKEKWIQARRKAYKGSFNHFLKTLTEQSFDDHFDIMNGKIEYMGVNTMQGMEANQFLATPWRNGEALQIRHKDTGELSEITFTFDNYLYLDDQGNLLNQENVYLTGQWSNDRMSVYLPQNYTPVVKGMN